MATERIIGIDFGTSTTVVRVKTYIDGVPEASTVLTESVKFDGKDTLPTLAFYDDIYNEYLMGDQAEREFGNEQGTLYRNFKLDLLSADPDVRQKAEDLIKCFFEYMFEAYTYNQENFTPCDDETTYVSYPAKWTRELDDTMVRIATEAGFRNVKGLDEPSAAIQTALVQKTADLQKLGAQSLTVLMIDMGAGTTDLALCRTIPGQKRAEIINTWPKSEEYAHFGGSEIDEILWSYIKEYVTDCGVQDPPPESQMISQTKAWKENTVSTNLKKNRSVDVCNFVNVLFTSGSAQKKQFPAFDRAKFEHRLDDYLRKFPELINGLLDNTADVSPSDIDLVILTGGHSQWYFADEILSGKLTKFGAVDLLKIRNEPERIIRFYLPQETVALGLAYQGLNVEPTPKLNKEFENSLDIEETDIVIQPSDSDNQITKKTQVDFSMPIDGVFQTTGRDIMVTGCIEKGYVKIYDTIKIIKPSGSQLQTVVIGIERLEKRFNFAGAGENVGLLLKDINRNQISCGDTIIRTENKAQEEEKRTELDYNNCGECEFTIEQDGIYATLSGGSSRRLIKKKPDSVIFSAIHHKGAIYYNTEEAERTVFNTTYYERNLYMFDLSSHESKSIIATNLCTNGILLINDALYAFFSIGNIVKYDLLLENGKTIFGSALRSFSDPVDLQVENGYVYFKLAGKVLNQKKYRLSLADDTVKEMQ